MDFKLLSLRKISTIDYTEYQKIGTGKLVQRIENGSSAGRNVLFDFWLCLIRELIPTIAFSIYFIWKIDKKITYALLVGYAVVFIMTNILLKFLYQIKEKILNSEELLNHYLVRGFMEMLVFRMNKQFPNEMEKTHKAKEDIVASKVKMNIFVFHSIWLFVLEAVMEGIGGCLSSGTCEAYIYSTYVFIYQYFDMDGLLISTIVSGILAVLFAIGLDECNEKSPCETGDKNQFLLC